MGFSSSSLWSARSGAGEQGQRMTVETCNGCGHELLRGSNFCAACGRRAPEAAWGPITETKVPNHSPRTTSVSHGRISGTRRGANIGRVVAYVLAFVLLVTIATSSGSTGVALILTAPVFAAVWVYWDARSRGMHNAGAWAFGVLLVIVAFLPLYLDQRRPRM